MCHLRTDNADIDRATTNQWLNTSSFKGQTEDFILAGQDQSISTRACQSRILNNGADPNFRPCTVREETVDNAVLACPKSVHISMIELLVSYFKLPHTEKWYEHIQQSVIESTELTILCDFTINTDRKIEANEPNNTIKKSEDNICIMIDITVLADKNISLKEFQKLSKLKNLKLRLQKCGKSPSGNKTSWRRRNDVSL